MRQMKRRGGNRMNRMDRIREEAEQG